MGEGARVEGVMVPSNNWASSCRPMTCGQSIERRPPTDWGKFVQMQDDRNVYQASPYELTEINIHRL